jgi:hypothetical protein
MAGDPETVTNVLALLKLNPAGKAFLNKYSSPPGGGT